MSKKIFSIGFCACVLFVFLLCAVDYINDKIPVFYTLSTKTNQVEATFSTSWKGSEDYPFHDEADEATESAIAAESDIGGVDTSSDGLSSLEGHIAAAADKILQLAESVNQRITKVTTNWTTRVTTSNPLYYTSVYVGKYFDRLCAYNLTTSLSAVNDTLDCSDIVIELQDGYLGRVMDEENIETYGLENVDSLVEFGLSIVEDNRNFLYVALPEKIEITDYSGVVSEIYEDHFGEMTQIALDAVSGAGLDSYNMADAMAEDGMDSVTSFYETDHHWRATTGLYACGILGEELNERYGYEIDTSLFDTENYTITTLEDWWIGSLGKKVTDVYHELEDFEIIMPDFETDLEVFRSNTNAVYYGSIDETLYDWSYLSGSHNLLTYNAYAFYGYGDLAYIKVHNNQVEDGSSVLILRNSYTDCVVPFFSTAVEDLSVLDLRHFNGCLVDLIEDVDPDTVVVMYSTSAFSAENEWDHANLFDFR